MNAHSYLDPRKVSDLNHQRVKWLTSTSSVPAELPPQPPRACFGRDELIERIVGLASKLSPIVLIGPGGIGKTSIALTVLHDARIKERFGDNRLFMRCDQFPATPGHFLRRLSSVTGAGIKNLEDLTPLRSFLSSKEMFIVLDNAESIIDPQGTSAQEIHTLVEELNQFNNLCICVTSRISTILPDCQTLDIPTLSMETARETFYHIYRSDERPDSVDNILKRLDFHPLSITLLATVAHHNKWDTNRMTEEWESQRTAVLQTDHGGSLAATIELSLASPSFKELGSYARALLEVVAFFPQGVNEDNLDWLFPTVSDGRNIFDKFCVLSLTYRSGNFVTLLAPLRDYLHPRDPKSSLLLYITKECYCSRLLINPNPKYPSFGETQWITSEDVNVEHLLSVFTSIEASSDNVWEACADFAFHLTEHKPRPIMLVSKIEGLPDTHPSKLRCLRALSELFHAAARYSEAKWSLVHTLKHHRERGDSLLIAETLEFLAHINRHLHLQEEGIPQLKEASEIYERCNNVARQKESLRQLTILFADINQLNLAEEAASRAINLILYKSYTYQNYEIYHVLGHACESRGETDAAITHLEEALGIASSYDWLKRQTETRHCLLLLFLREDRFDDAQVHLEALKPLCSTHHPRCLDQLMVIQAYIRFSQGRIEEAKPELLRLIDVYDGARDFTPLYLEDLKVLLQVIEVGTKAR